ncbi:MAG TPA: high-potential iron-sulfur protein [Pseudomonadales bacterium]
MINRRTFVQLSSVAAAAAFTHQARGGEALQALPPDNPQAQALKYVENVEANPPQGYPAGSGQTCANCMHYTSIDQQWGSCAIFPGFKVHAPGWCSAWVKKP